MEPKQYLSTYMYEGVRQWTAISNAAPLCAATPDKGNAINAFRRWFPKADMPVWNGDIGQFVALEEVV